MRVLYAHHQGVGKGCPDDPFVVLIGYSDHPGAITRYPGRRKDRMWNPVHVCDHLVLTCDRTERPLRSCDSLMIGRGTGAAHGSTSRPDLPLYDNPGDRTHLIVHHTHDERGGKRGTRCRLLPVTVYLFEYAW